MFVEIKGVQFVNKGAELMLHAILQKLAAHDSNIKFVLRHNTNSPYEKRAKVGGYQKLDLKRFGFLEHLLTPKRRKKLNEKWGVVTSSDIDVILDASGFAYGDQWGSNKIKKEVNKTTKRGGKYLFLPQAFGPFSKQKDIELLKEIIPSSGLVIAREKDSYTHLKDICPDNSNIRLFPDFTNLVYGTCPDYFHDGQKKILLIPNSKMISSKNKSNQWINSYVQVFLNAIEAIEALGYVPVLLNHSGAEDKDICSDIQKRLNRPVELICEEDPINVKGIIGESAAAICSRFHGCVSALSQGTPCLGTSWSHKYENLFEDYNRKDMLLTPTSSKEEIIKILSESLRTDTKEYDTYVQRIDDFKEKSELMWKELIEQIY